MTNEDFIPFAKETIDVQIAGLQELQASLGTAFREATETLLSVKGRVIITGMGKSGHIGRKIAATMASVGTQTYFVHPAEASHGDMGMISTDDAVIAISNSGETGELLDVLLYCNRFSIPLIGITKNPDSTLGQRSNICLQLPAAKEACPLAKAPTTSTTMTLVLGDALALVLLKAKGFTANDFGNYHPGGKLGAQLLKVSEILADDDLPLPVVTSDAVLKDLMVLMSQGQRGCVGVVGADGSLAGIITDGDLRRYFLEATDLSVQASSMMTKGPKTVSPKDLAGDALSLMQANRISAVFAVDEEDKPLGVLDIKQLMRLGVL